MDFQKKNQFIEKYMTMLGHYEFGLNYKFFKIDESTNNDFSFNAYKLESWLKLWFNYYRYAIQNCNSKNIKFISYENFSLNSRKYFDELVPEKKNFRNLNFDAITNRNTNFSNSDKHLIKKIYNLYDELKTLDTNC